MANFINVQTANGDWIALNVATIESFQPYYRGRGPTPVDTKVYHKGGTAHIAIPPSEFAEFIRQANCEVIDCPDPKRQEPA